MRPSRLLLALALLLAAPGSLFGQVGARTPELDYFLSRYDADGQAVGARLMWELAPLSRTSLGGYLVHSPDEEGWTGSWRYGAQADVRVTRVPVAGRVDPIVSLGVGAIRALDDREPEARGQLFERSTHLSVAPGLGVRFRLAPGFGLRGDARQVLDFREGVERNLELSGGLSLGV